MNNINGELVHFSVSGNFVYAYHCELCKTRFLEYAPEISAPAICHMCFAGLRGKHKRKKSKTAIAAKEEESRM